MYKELYAAWQWEITDPTLGALPRDFYVRVAEYLKRINQENPADAKSVKVNLLEREAQNVRQMLDELLWLRYKKIVKTVSKDKKVPVELLTAEEAKMCETFVNFTFAYQKFQKSLMQGDSAPIPPSPTEPVRVVIKSESPQAQSQPQAPPAPKRLTLRFQKAIPAIMGADMKSYGPFAAEDVASLPAENAKILVKQGLAVLVEVS